MESILTMAFRKAFHRIPYHYLKKLLIITGNEIRSLIGESNFLLITDSTGIKIDRMYYLSLIKCKQKKRRKVDKLNVFAEYYPEEKAITIANADAIFSSDAYSAIKMLDEIEIGSSVIFADAGFDC